jgi:flavodoxin
LKNLIVYSSLTGNTKKVAEAITEVLGNVAVFPVETAPDPADYGLIAVGFWVDRGTADKKAQEYLKQIHGKKVALFATLGAYPDSEHAAKSMANAIVLLDESNKIMGTFICQGKVDPRLVERFKELPADHPHAITSERQARHSEAAKHPDENDLQKAKEIFDKIMTRVTLR